MYHIARPAIPRPAPSPIFVPVLRPDFAGCGMADVVGVGDAGMPVASDARGEDGLVDTVDEESMVGKRVPEEDDDCAISRPY